VLKFYFISAFALLSFNGFSQYNFYFGNIHAHTSYSDGNKDSTASGYYYPGQDFYYAKGSYHMDYLGISEHNHYSSNNNPGMHVSDYAKGLAQADTANANGTFVCMYGFEWGVISSGGHVVTYGVPGLVGWETGSGGWGSTNNYDIFCAKSDYTNFWPIINSYPNAFCTLAHPQSGDYNDLLGTLAYSTTGDNAIAGVAIRSGSALTTTNNYSDPAPTLYESSYLKALARGYHVGPTADHDNHYTTIGRTNHIRTVVLARSLNRDSIMAAYRTMHFYASDDWDAKVTFSINGNMMGSEFNTGFNSSISVTVNDELNNSGGADPINKIDIYYGVPGSLTNATILTTATGTNTLSYAHTTALNNKFYYFAKITQTDGDIIWTAPVWVNRTSIDLPLDLMTFSGKESANGIDLSWTTTQELNLNYFETEHSADGIHFESIGTVASKFHNSTTATNYTATDFNPINGLNFYRLKAVDMDGKITYSNIVAVYKYRQFVKLSVYPNPVSNMLNLRCISQTDEEVLCKIYNSEGREVKKFSTHISMGDNRIVSDVASLPNGIYFIVVSKNSQQVAEISFVKQ